MNQTDGRHHIKANETVENRAKFSEIHMKIDSAKKKKGMKETLTAMNNQVGGERFSWFLFLFFPNSSLVWIGVV